MENINYGEYFRLLLKLYKISQAELGKYIGLSQRQISRYITNEGSYKSEYLSKILSGIEDIANDLINPYRYEGIDNGKALIKLELPKNELECNVLIQQLNQKIEHNDTFQIEDVHSEEYQALQHRWYLYQKISDIWMEIAAEKILYWNKMRDHLLDTEELEINFIKSYRLMPPRTQNIIDELLESETLNWNTYRNHNSICNRITSLLHLSEYNSELSKIIDHKKINEFNGVDRITTLNDFVDYCYDKHIDSYSTLSKFETIYSFSGKEWFLAMKYRFWILNHPNQSLQDLIYFINRMENEKC